MASAQVVETSVANESPSQNSSHEDDHFQSRSCCVDVAECLPAANFSHLVMAKLRSLNLIMQLTDGRPECECLFGHSLPLLYGKEKIILAFGYYFCTAISVCNKIAILISSQLQNSPFTKRIRTCYLGGIVQLPVKKATHKSSSPSLHISRELLMVRKSLSTQPIFD